MSVVDTTAPLRCATCGKQSRHLYTADDLPFGSESEQWYECDEGHATKKGRR